MCVSLFLKPKINVGKWNIDDEFIAATKTKKNNNNETKLYGLPNRKTTLKVLGAHQHSFEIFFKTCKFCNLIINLCVINYLMFYLYQNDSLLRILLVLLPSRLHGGSPCPVKSLSLR